MVADYASYFIYCLINAYYPMRVLLRDIHDANSSAMSEWAYVPPYLPALVEIPIALTALIHFEGDMVKA